MNEAVKCPYCSKIFFKTENDICPFCKKDIYKSYKENDLPDFMKDLFNNFNK